MLPFVQKHWAHLLWGSYSTDPSAPGSCLMSLLFNPRPLLMPHSLQLPWLFSYITYCECQSQSHQGSGSMHKEIFPAKTAHEFLSENLVPVPLESSLQLLEGWHFISLVAITIFSSFFQVELVMMLERVLNLSSSACFVPPAFPSAGKGLPCHPGNVLYLTLGPGFGCSAYPITFAPLLCPN